MHTQSLFSGYASNGHAASWGVDSRDCSLHAAAVRKKAVILVNQLVALLQLYKGLVSAD